MKFVDHLTRREYIKTHGIRASFEPNPIYVRMALPIILIKAIFLRELHYKTISEISSLIASKQVSSLVFNKNDVR